MMVLIELRIFTSMIDTLVLYPEDLFAYWSRQGRLEGSTASASRGWATEFELKAVTEITHYSISPRTSSSLTPWRIRLLAAIG